MRIGILGSGIVGQTLGLKLAQLGHSVILGTGDPSRLDEPKGRGTQARTLRAWLEEAGAGASVASFREAAAQGELVINALNGAASLSVLQGVGAEHLQGKTLMDVSNPLDFSHGYPWTLIVKDTDSLAEMLQRAIPGAHVVKTLNTMVAAVMVKPSLVGDGDITVFLSGNDSQAKSQAAGLLGEMGWVDILDLGDISTARGVEMLSPLGHTLLRRLNTEYVTVKIVR